jgi:hypothetical protein
MFVLNALICQRLNNWIFQRISIISNRNVIAQPRQMNSIDTNAITSAFDEKKELNARVKNNRRKIMSIAIIAL